MDSRPAHAGGPGGDTVRAVANAAVESLNSFVLAIAVLGIVVGMVAWLVDRRRRARRQRDAGSEPLSFSDWERAHSLPLSVGGLVAIGLMALSQITGSDVAIWAAAAAAIWLIGIRIISGEDEDQPVDFTA